MASLGSLPPPAFRFTWIVLRCHDLLELSSWVFLMAHRAPMLPEALRKQASLLQLCRSSVAPCVAQWHESWLGAQGAFCHPDHGLTPAPLPLMCDGKDVWQAFRVPEGMDVLKF